MTRPSLLTVGCSCFIVVVESLLLTPVVVFRLLRVFKETSGVVSNLSFCILLLLCLVTTPICYFKVFWIIHRHHKQIHANGLCQNFGQPAFNLTKYKKSVVFILYSQGIFYTSFLPLLVFVRRLYCYLTPVLLIRVSVSYFIGIFVAVFFY